MSALGDRLRLDIEHDGWAGGGITLSVDEVSALADYLDAAEAEDQEAFYAIECFHRHKPITGWTIDRLMDARDRTIKARAALLKALGGAE